MTTIEVSFTRELTLAAIDGIERYYETIESQLNSAKVEERQRVDETIKGMGLRGDEELAEWNIAMQEHEMNFDMLLPNFFRYSCIVLLFLVVENKLGEVCEAAYDENKLLPPPPSPKQSIINGYQKYLSEKVGITGLHWEDLHELNKLRNCIIHASGKVKGCKDETFLQQLAKRGLGVSISGENDDHNDNIRPLYLEEDMLVLNPVYITRVIKNVRAFFEELCNSLPLPRLVIKLS